MSMSGKPIEPPSSVAVARALSAMTSELKDDINFERASLEEVCALLSQDPPNVDQAIGELDEAMAHAFRGNWREDARPEAWLVAACQMLLKTQG